jgi:hypothetical protein
MMQWPLDMGGGVGVMDLNLFGMVLRMCSL